MFQSRRVDGAGASASGRPDRSGGLHPFLDFSDVTDRTLREGWEANLFSLRTRDIDHGKSVSWEVLETLGIAGTIRTMMTFTYPEDPDEGDFIVFDAAMVRLSEIREIVVRELVLEFYSTFSFDADAVGHTQARVIRFRLGGVFRQMSLIEFAVRLGLYAEDETVGRAGDALLEYLGVCDRAPRPNFSYGAAWSFFGRGNFRGSRTLESAITDPHYRLIHRIISCCVVPRKESQEKMSNRALWVLHSFTPDANRIDLPWLLAKTMTEIGAHRPSTTISLGFLVSRLARSFGLFGPGSLDSLTLIRPEMALIGLEHLRRMHVAHFNYNRSGTVWGDPQQEAGAGAGAGRDDDDDDDSEDEEEEEEQQPRQSSRQQQQPAAAPGQSHVDQAILDRLDRIEITQQRNFRHTSYEFSRVRYSQDWMQRYVSQWTGPMVPPSAPEPYRPPPYWDPSVADFVPPGFDSWDDWFSRQG